MSREKEFLYRYLPREYLYLTKQKTILYKEENLKTDYIINIIHDLLLQYYISNDVKYKLWSIILKKKYGKIYNLYMDYILEIKFLSLVCNYYRGKKAKTYKINIGELDVVKVKLYDKILIKKYSKNYIFDMFTSKQESPINEDIKKILIDDLYHVRLDYDSSVTWLEKEKNNKSLDLTKFYKNMCSIDSIKTGHIFYKFDSYGRLHTNYTILKKHIRVNNITIDNEPVSEIDISNSQPFFFAIYLKNEIGENNFNAEIWKYIECVKNGLIYDELLEKYPTKIRSRNEAKTMMYRILFGKNIDYMKESIMFSKLYPTVYDYIKEYKQLSESYKSLSHELQLLESNFIFNVVVKEIKEKFPKIRLITVHDSIIYPTKYKDEVTLIFNKHLKKLL